MCAKKRHRNSSDFLRYLKDDLSNQERFDLESGVEADAFEKEAMEGLESISPEKAEEDILTLHASLNKRLGRRRRRTWYSIAATAASILLVGTIFLNIYDLNPASNEIEPLTEETFRSLDSEKEVETIKEVAPAELAPAEATPEAAPKAAPEAAPEATPEAPPEIAPAKQVPEVVSKEVSEETSYEMVMEEDAEIVALEAEPQRSKKSVVSAHSAGARAQSEPLPENQVNDQISGQVSGIVVSSEDQDPLPGASLVVRGSNSSTFTDTEGRFSLPADDSQTTVIASYIGMETEEFLLDSEEDNQLVMQADPVMLDEIVVIKTEEGPPSYSAAEPPGGYRAYRDYIEENMVFPEGYTPGKREIVVLKCTVTSSGSISDIIPLKSPGESYSLEAIRLIQEGPVWTPAEVNSKPIDEQFRIRIIFKK